jgi:D-alanyl-D-alanine carboxypeptidase
MLESTENSPNQNNQRNLRKKIAGILLLAILAIFVVLMVGANKATAPATQSSDIKRTSSASPSAQSSQAFNKSQFSLTDPTSIWVVVNKSRHLQPKNYAPSDLVIPSIPLRTNSSNGEMHLRQTPATALQKMTADAKAQGIYFMLASGYRSYALQVSVYNSEVTSYGQARADSESARPGYSEHQTGLALDLEDSNRSCEVTDCFANLPEGKWLAANAYKYGFLVRYQQGKEAITGYRYEPWHIRYIGTDLSNEMHKDNTATLEEFFGLPAAPDYL